MTNPPVGDQTWLALVDGELPVGEAQAWATTPRTGALVSFSGIVRDHAPGRNDVSALTYEAYEEHATARMAAVVAQARTRWPDTDRIVVLHRLGNLVVGDVAVIVVVGSPHRPAAFAAAAYCIDEVKATVPIWKHETWAGGEAWGTDATSLSSSGAGER